uniref:Protein lap1-like n=1 Tax=Saccoglossus kowalevskii TaxID=10224 RepID=A0ABM0MXI8_SACKO
MTSSTSKWSPDGETYIAADCGLNVFPPEVFDKSHRNVKGILLNGNNISEIPENISCLRHLEWLDLSDNNLGTIPDNIGNLSQLTYLSLKGNPLINLPMSLRRLKNLHTFTCDTIDGICEQNVRIWNNKTETRQLFDKIFETT